MGVIAMLMMAHMALGASRFESMTWFNEPDAWAIRNGTLSMRPTGRASRPASRISSAQHLPDIRRVEWLEKDAKGK